MKVSLPKDYFAAPEEAAFIYLIDPQTSPKAKEEILQQLLYERLYHLTESVVIRYGGYAGLLGQDEAIAVAFADLRSKWHKFRPWVLDKTGRKIQRAYSYLSTIVKNSSLGYAKKAYNYDTSIVSFELGDQDTLEADERFRYEQVDETRQHVAQDQRFRLVMKRIQEELSSSPTLRANDAAVGRALLAIMEDSATLQNWDDPRITVPYMRKGFMDAVYEQTGLNPKEINAGLRRFMPLYAQICKEEEEQEDPFE